MFLKSTWLINGILLIVNAISPRQRQILNLLRTQGPLSRRELFEQTGMRPNTVGVETDRLLQERFIRPCQAEVVGKGRPKVPLEIDPQGKHVIGLAIRDDRVSAVKLNLLGKEKVARVFLPVTPRKSSVTQAKNILKDWLDRDTHAIGIGCPGFVDQNRKRILFNAMAKGGTAVDLNPLAKQSQGPLVLENDMHALAARWLMTHAEEANEDVLLVYFDDGQIGAGMLIGGQPNRGCVTGGNELGHVRFPLETKRCYCGHKGCLEKIFSTEFLKSQSRKKGKLAERIQNFNGEDSGLLTLTQYLAHGIANTVNFLRVNRVILVSAYMQYPLFEDHLKYAIRNLLLTPVAQNARIESWNLFKYHAATDAGWLALASVYQAGWAPGNDMS